MRGLRIAAWAVAVSAYVVIVLGAFDVGGARGWIPLALFPFVALAFLAPPTVGLLIALRQPRNVIAWIMLLGPLPILVTIPLAFVLSEGWTLQIDRANWPFLYAWPIAVAYVFPNGHLLSPRWRWVVGVAVTCWVGFLTVAMLDPEPFYGDDASVPNPLADNAVAGWIEDTGFSWIWVVFWLGILGSLFAGALAVGLRLRRSTGIQRLQTMWLAWAAALIPLGLLMCGASSWVLGDSLIDWIVFPLLLVMQVAVAASVGIAVARYRLYDIERIVNRHGRLCGAHVRACSASYVRRSRSRSAFSSAAAPRGSPRWRRSPSRSRSGPFAHGFRILSTGGTAAHGTRAYAASATFEDEVRDGRRAPEEIGAVVAEALGDPLAELLFWLPETEAYADASGEIVDLLTDARAQTRDPPRRRPDRSAPTRSGAPRAT